MPIANSLNHHFITRTARLCLDDAVRHKDREWFNANFILGFSGGGHYL